MIIEVDEYKKKIDGYSPERSEDFHRESAKLADKDFIKQLKTKKFTKVVLMAGGTASGKTEYATSYIKNKKTLVYDGTLKNYSGFTIKLQNIKRHCKNVKEVKVILVVPKDTIYSFSAFLKRERKMNVGVFFETHIKSKDTVVRILSETKTKVEIYASEYNEKTHKLSFVKVKMSGGRKYTANILENIAKALQNLAKENGLEINK